MKILFFSSTSSNSSMETFSSGCQTRVTGVSLNPQMDYEWGLGRLILTKLCWCTMEKGTHPQLLQWASHLLMVQHPNVCTRQLEKRKCTPLTGKKNKVFSCIMSVFLNVFLSTEARRIPETSLQAGASLHWLLLVKYSDYSSSPCCFCITGSIQGYVFQFGSFNTI